MRVFAFAIEGAADSREGCGERKDIARNQQIGIFRSDWMPVHTLGSNGHFRHEIGATNCDTFAGGTTQRDPAYDSVFHRNLLLIEKLTEPLCFSVGRNGRCQPHAKTKRTNALDTFACARPCSGPAM